MNFLYNKYKLKDSINSLYLTQGYYERDNSSPQELNHNPTHNKVTKSAINYSNILQLNDIITAFNYVKKLEEQKSLSLNDILNELVSYIITNKVYTPIKTARIISKLSEIEYYLAGNINTSIQLGAIISILKSV